MQVTFRLVEPGRHELIPRRASAGAAGLDLKASKLHSLPPGERVLIPTGVELAIPRGYEGQIRPRSGLAHRHGVTVLNAPGTVDADYRGEICVLLINHGGGTYDIMPGDRIAQLVIAPVAMNIDLVAALELDATDRGSAGFGSTGK